MIKQAAHEALSEAKKARLMLTKTPGRLSDLSAGSSPGEYLKNYAQCLLNRQIDIFDDALFLLENQRTASACTVSRGLIETYAVAKLLGSKIQKILATKTGQNSLEECLEIILRFTNSSRFKETEQKKAAKGILNVSDYQLTQQARERILQALATSEHVLNALRALFEEELKYTNAKESRFELTYDYLSEWVHPSQTSIFHQYTPETHLVPTSRGLTSIFDNAELGCARALNFIMDTKNVHEWLMELAAEITHRANAVPSR